MNVAQHQLATLSDLNIESPQPGYSNLGLRHLHPKFWMFVLCKRAKAWRNCLKLGVELMRSTFQDIFGSTFDQSDLVAVSGLKLGSLPQKRSVAMYVHFSPIGTVSEMVQMQVRAYRDLGFDVIFISNSEKQASPSWHAIDEIAEIVVHRRNHGYDFGAWKDVFPLVAGIWPNLDELLLVNDSCLGPLRPLDQSLQAMRSGGNGIFGMLESLQGGPHLQSWFILARGMRAIGDIEVFLQQLKVSSSKWLTIRRGELVLSKYMLSKGHRVRTVHSYSSLAKAALKDSPQSQDLLDALARHYPLSASQTTQLVEGLLKTRHLNPSHFFWRVLLNSPFCSFLKTELIKNNPGDLPNVSAMWKRLLPKNSPCSVAVLESHMAEMSPGKPLLPNTKKDLEVVKYR